MVTVIRNGTVCLEAGPCPCDLLITEGVITEIGGLRSVPPQTRLIDATGLSVLPGAIDFHVHLDDEIGPFRIADDYASGSTAAICSGVTTLISFVTQRNGETLRAALQKHLMKAGGKSHCDYAFHLTPTRFTDDDWIDIEAVIDEGYKTFKFYTTYTEAGLYLTYDRLGAIMKQLTARGCTVLVHCEDQERLDAISRYSMDFGNAYSHAVLRPEEVETIAIERILDASERSNARVHIVHVSTSKGAELIDKARRRAQVTCETAPHYLLLDDGYLMDEDGHRYLCTPPLRNERIRSEMETLAARGKFDLFATDHCPFRRQDKDDFSDVTTVPSGIAGIGALVPLMHGLLVTKHGRDLSELVTRIATNPAKVAGIYPRKGTIAVGSDADLILVRLDGPERPIVSSFSDCYETYPGRTTTLDFRYVFLRGEPIVRDNALVEPDRPRGRSLWPN